ncbi:amidohydrolase family protein [Sphingopyxis sp. NFH-91]|uniref:amidohydrolase family protein n=1 Tax=Sphingopyxis sp. NFH-91 TaxID=2744457 RepID=UPI001F325718|nr:amidohydrolase family protein [Sphingopyxis sp. NFH-91]
MLDGQLIIDAVVHPWNMSPENQNPAAMPQVEAVYASHKLSFDEANSHFVLQPDEFYRDLSFDVIGRAEFAESPADFAVLHSLPNLGFGLGPITLPEKCVAFRNAYPDRVKMYGTVGTPIVASAIDEIRRQIDEYGIDGVKLYPAFFYDNIGQGWRLDGEDWATPFLEYIQKAGINRVAVHKALWLEPAPREAFGIDDFASPLSRFPDIRFEMVHGGAAFLDETIALLQRHPNLYLTLETVFSYILVKPRVFAKILGRLITEVGSERLLFASGNNLAHPLPLIEAFRGFEFAPEHVAEFGIRQLTQQDRDNIMGLNSAKLHDFDVDALLPRIAADEFSAIRAEGVPQPWSLLRE